MDIRDHFRHRFGASSNSQKSTKSHAQSSKTEKQAPSKMAGAGKKGSGFEEPELAGAASFEDHGGQAYGTTEDMQPLGERPSSKVKQRVKHEAPRKSALGRNWAAVNSDVQETPDSTPGPATELEPLSQPLPVIKDDDNDGDYAPKVKSNKAPKKERAQRASKSSRQSTTPAAPPSSASRVSKSGAIKKPSKSPSQSPVDDRQKLARVAEAAKERAIQVGKPELAAAVHEIYQHSLTDSYLTELLGAILSQKATPVQTRDFQGYVKRAKQKLKDAKKNRDSVGVDAKTEPLANGASRRQSIPLRSPSHPTHPSPTPAFATAATTTAIPSTEITDTGLSKKNKDMPPKQHQPKMTPPLDDRADGNASDSSLTELESDGEGNHVSEDDELQKPTAATVRPPAATHNRKDHAAERGTLAAPKTAGSKRPSAETDALDDEYERALLYKKQKLEQSIVRDPDHQYQESSVRPILEPPSASRLRSNKAAAVVPPPLKLSLKTNGNVHATRAAKRPSSDADSPLSELSSREGSPALLEGGPPVKRAKTKTSPEKKKTTAHVISTTGERGKESWANANDNDSDTENNDFCTACGGSGYLLCCDGCDRAFHFKCVDPPLTEDSKELDEPWYCAVCQDLTRASQGEKKSRGLFAPALNDLKRKFTTLFELPQDIRDHFHGTGADADGNFIEPIAARTTRASGRTGFVDVPDLKRTKDAKGNNVYCFSCNRSSEGRRELTACDSCGTYWHLDCLDPPAANPPRKSVDGKVIYEWLCPLHIDHDLRQVDVAMLNPHKRRRTIHLRKPRNAKMKEPALTRGMRNNGIIEVVNDESDTESEFYDEDRDENITYKMPSSGIKLDFLDRVKRGRIQDLHTRAVQRQLFNEAAINNAAAVNAVAATAAAATFPSAMELPNFANRSFSEKQVALQLAQLAKGNLDLNFGARSVENLVGTLIAEAPPSVSAAMADAEATAADNTTKTFTEADAKPSDPDTNMSDSDAKDTAKTAGAAPPSPPTSEQIGSFSAAEERRQLLALQELIKRRLEGM